MNLHPVIVWFRRDLRLADNPALSAAIESGASVLPLYIDDRATTGSDPIGAASSWWLHQSLKAIGDSISRSGNRLILRRGAPIEVLRDIVAETGARAVFWNRQYEPSAIARDIRIKAVLREMGLEAVSHNGALLHEPWTIKNQAGRPFRVFTPYWRHCVSLPVMEPLAAPDRILPFKEPVRTLDLDELELEPAFDWTSGIQNAWQPGEASAGENLDQFLSQSFADYDTGRDRPDQPGTSRLSPHLHFGEISPRQIRWRLQRHAERNLPPPSQWQGSRFLAELGWREFAHHLLYHFPETVDAPLRPEFENFPWRDNPDGLKAWQTGQTGYPIVDAGMRELWSTAWMHNRVRMIAASFLVKDLLIHWREGAAWFMDTLVDADLAANTLGWQWTAGCGADAAPFFRIFNPTNQGERFDPDGGYVRRWIPELSRLPTRWIHQPWNAPEAILRSSGVQLGENYPQPVVSHTIARNVALEAYQRVKRGQE